MYTFSFVYIYIYIYLCIYIYNISIATDNHLERFFSKKEMALRTWHEIQHFEHQNPQKAPKGILFQR